MRKIPFTMPHFGQPEVDAINDLLNSPEKLTSENYMKLCRQFLESYYQKNVLPTHSCTAALEMCAILLNLQPGDEVIIPSYTFVSTANAFALFGAKPVFVDCKYDTLNIDPAELEKAITEKTKAIVVMHYAGVACDMDSICKIADAHNLPIIEDAAQCIGASYLDKKLGTFGQLSALSFHNTKNITSGLGGALIINDPKFLDRAKIIWQKGTNREAFIEGAVDKYTWQDLGSSYVLNELGAALLYGQLKRIDEITERRSALWNKYHVSLVKAEEDYEFRRPIVPEGCDHNAHIYYLIAPSELKATQLRKYLSTVGITAPSHYNPLHLSPAAERYSPTKSLPVCESLYKRIVRLPLFEGLGSNIDYVIEQVYRGIDLIK